MRTPDQVRLIRNELCEALGHLHRTMLAVEAGDGGGTFFSSARSRIEMAEQMWAETAGGE